VVVLVSVGWLGTLLPVTAQGGDMAPMDIGASGPNGHEIGARFSVMTLGGEDLGSCTLEGARDEPIPLSCRVDVPLGTTVVVTLDLTSITPGMVPVENPLVFDTTGDPGAASHWGVFFEIVPESGSTSSGQLSDVAILTTENGESATDVCYVLVDYSLEGCDENDDGRVTFAEVPYGDYIVHQTADLGAGRTVEDFAIEVVGDMQEGWETFEAEVVSSEAPSAVDVALITREPNDGDLLTGACYVLVDYSLEGCDENGDGQVTFDAIPYGTYTVHQTRPPTGYEAINDHEITVEPVSGIPGLGTVGYPLGFVVKQAPEQNAPDTRNVSVVLLDMRNNERASGDICVEFVGGSNEGCDRDLLDGQIDFLDVPEGTYELRFTRLPAGYETDLFDSGPIRVTIDADAGGPANLMIFLLVASPEPDSGTSIGPQDDYDAMVGRG
jgi:uncharacterized surface anchored protein